jgi:hypothetical protein
MFNNPSETTSKSNWSQVLLAFYRQPDGRITQFNLAHYVPENHKLCEETGLSGDEVQDSLKYLIDDVELIRIESNAPDEDQEYVLNRDGFEVSHQLVKDNRRETQNAMLVGFTLVLAISAVLQALTNISEIEGTLSIILYGVLIIANTVIALTVWISPRMFNRSLY